MIMKRISLWEPERKLNDGGSGYRPYIDTYILDGPSPRAGVLVLPGGGYGGTSDREAESVAIAFNAAGFHAFVLYYSVSPARHPQPVRDAARAMCILRQNAEEWKLLPEAVAVCGFSAGGHLAASLSVHWDKDFLKGVQGIIPEKSRPDASILAYPVITAGEFVHKGSFLNLLGPDPDPGMTALMSLENQVHEGTPPAFLWHTVEDKGVPVENSLLYAQGLRKLGIPYELHVYPKGPHGLSLATRETARSESQLNSRVSGWIHLCTGWLKELFGIPPG
ncbi:MAG TPA: acetylesterase [Clostridiales bacterium]|nr:acetylesterase [Clostridiales bacterium]